MVAGQRLGSHHSGQQAARFSHGRAGNFIAPSNRSLEALAGRSGTCS
jgi:hypothetical protein